MSSRLDKTILNAKVNLFFNFGSFILAFFSRRIFLERLGTEFLGLTSTLGNLLGFLSLAELGVGSAIAYVLYKPLADNDQKSINEIISILGYFYRWVGLAIGAGGIILSCFLPIIYAKSAFPLPVVYFGFYSFLISSLIGYFINYRMTLLNADQKNYVVTKYYKSGNIIQIITQMGFAYYIASPFIYITILLVTSIAYSLILNWKINKTYPELRTNIAKGREYLRIHPKILRLTKQIFIQKIMGFAAGQMTPLMLYAFVSLSSVTCFGNYESLITKFSLVTYALFSSVFASVGNLIASSTREKTFEVMKELFSLSFFITGLCLLGIFMFIEDFVALWIGSEYILGKPLLILFLINFFVTQQAGIVEMFTGGFGLFSDIYAPAVESILFLIIAIVGGFLWGEAGVFLGTVVSRFIIWQLWKIYYVFSRGFKMPQRRYWGFWSKHLLVQTAICGISYVIIRGIHPTPMESWPALIMYAAITTLLYCILGGVLMYLLAEGSKEVFWRLWKRFGLHRESCPAT